MPGEILPSFRGFSIPLQPLKLTWNPPLSNLLLR
jgi:hypothetical protein